MNQIEEKLENFRKNSVKRAQTFMSYENEEQAEKRVEESVIMIDFFNPSEEQKKKLDPRLAVSNAN